MPKTIFVVDDNDVNLETADRALRDRYRVFTLPGASRMFEMLEKIRPDLILLDIEMPEIDGFEALRRLKSDKTYRDIPVIFLTGLSDETTEVTGFEMGVVDFITKPFSGPVLLNRIRTHLSIESIVRDRTEQLEQLQSGLVYIIADLVESRDRATGGHIERTAGYLKILIDAMVDRGLYIDEMTSLDLDALYSSARLHDIGKITVPDSVLNKLGSLSLEEFEMMKTHPEAGEQVIDKIINRIGSVKFLENAKLFAGSHHERWDGTGYPRGLTGTDIPLQGRIMAIVDVYDALLSDRAYKKQYTEEEVVDIVRVNKGKLFDPYIADVFIDVIDDISEARREFFAKLAP